MDGLYLFWYIRQDPVWIGLHAPLHMVEAMKPTPLPLHTIVSNMSPDLEAICHKKVNPRYVLSSIESAAQCIFVLDFHPEYAAGFRVQGVGVLHISDDKKGLYLSTLCAKKVGGKSILAFLYKIARSYGYEHVALDALEDVISYYARQGYELRDSCEGEPLIEISPTLIHRIQSGEVGNVYEDAEFKAFLAKVRKLELHVTKDWSSEACKNPHAPINDFIEQRCLSEGVRMTRCLSRKSRRSPSKSKSRSKSKSKGSKQHI